MEGLRRLAADRLSRLENLKADQFALCQQVLYRACKPRITSAGSRLRKFYGVLVRAEAALRQAFAEPARERARGGRRAP